MRCQGSICHEVKILNNMIKRYADSVINHRLGTEITEMQCRVIGFLHHSGERPVYQRDIEARFSINRATTSKMLTLMEKNGLITRSSVESDARLKQLRLTERASEYAQQVQQELDACEQLVLHGLTVEEKDTLLRLLQRLESNICASEHGERGDRAC